MTEEVECADVTKELKGTTQKIKVRVYQTPLPEEFRDTLMATGVAEIYVDDKKVTELPIPWPMPRGEMGIALMVQTLAESPGIRHTRYQPVLDAFVKICEGYEPVKIFWGKPD